MRLAILGDVHANLEALEAVVQEGRRLGVDRWVQTGDVVGYGADPSACIRVLQDLGAVVCLGNHDAAVLGTLATDYFNPYARAAVEWTREQLTAEELDYLGQLPLVVEDPVFTLVHGSLHEPERFGYVASPVEAAESLERQTKQLCFVGHTHVPAVFGLPRGGEEEDRMEVLFEPEFTLPYSGYERCLVNVGSVGQPRDEDPRAAFLIVDTGDQTVALHRTTYEVERAQRKILANGLPKVLADRLALGV